MSDPGRRAPGHSCPSLPNTDSGRAGWNWGKERERVKQLMQCYFKRKQTECFHQFLEEINKDTTSVESTYVSRQTGAMSEQRKAWAWGWQPVCSRGLQSSERGTTSPSRLLWPKKLGRRISEYPTSLHIFIWLGIATQRVDWPMSNAIRGHVRARRATAKNTAMTNTRKIQSPKRWMMSFYWSSLLSEASCRLQLASELQLLALYTEVSQSHQSASLLSITYQRRRDDVLGDNGLFCDDRRQRGGCKSMGCVWGGVKRGDNGPSINEVQSQELEERRPHLLGTDDKLSF